jgi:hypothetical protein
MGGGGGGGEIKPREGNGALWLVGLRCGEVEQAVRVQHAPSHLPVLHFVSLLVQPPAVPCHSRKIRNGRWLLQLSRCGRSSSSRLSGTNYSGTPVRDESNLRQLREWGWSTPCIQVIRITAGSAKCWKFHGRGRGCPRFALTSTVVLLGLNADRVPVR